MPSGSDSGLKAVIKRFFWSLVHQHIPGDRKVSRDGADEHQRKVPPLDAPLRDINRKMKIKISAVPSSPLKMHQKGGEAACTTSRQI